MAEHDEDGSLHYRISGAPGGITPAQARGIIRKLKLQSNDDCLFNGVPQSWSVKPE